MAIFKDCLDLPLFLNYLEERKFLKESTLYVYRYSLMAFLRTNPKLDKVEDYNKYIVEKCVKHRSFCSYRVLRHFIKWKIKDRDLRGKIFDNLIVPPEPQNIIRTRVSLDEDKLLEILNSIETPLHKVLTLVMLQTGIRVGDIMRLKKGKIKNETYKNQVVMRLELTGKGGKLNNVFVFDTLTQEIILDYITRFDIDDEYYFMDRKNVTLMQNGREKVYTNYQVYKSCYSTYMKDLKKALITNGVSYDDFAAHDFRRAFAKKLWEWKNDILVVQRGLNHARIETTAKYLRKAGLQNIDIFEGIQKI